LTLQIVRQYDTLHMKQSTHTMSPVLDYIDVHISTCNIISKFYDMRQFPNTMGISPDNLTLATI